jgi:hypothetical protein
VPSSGLHDDLLEVYSTLSYIAMIAVFPEFAIEMKLISVKIPNK